MARKNPTTHRQFSPSYEAASQAEYERAVADGDKRSDHIMVEGGRSHARYGEPDDIIPTTRKTRARLRDGEQPWEARTQSPDVWQISLKRAAGAQHARDRLADTIRQAIANARASSKQGALGFSVPDTVYPLISAGMPGKAARILVERAPRAFFPDVPAPDVMRVGQRTVESDIAAALGRPLQIRFDGRLILKVPKKQVPLEVQRIRLLARRPQEILSGADVENAFATYRERVTGKDVMEYRRELHDQAFLQSIYDVLLAQIRTAAKQQKTTDITLEITLKGPEGAVVRTLSVREHSVLRARAADATRVRYKTLRNVGLNELPALLASLARRKERKGRQLAVAQNTSENPMARRKAPVRRTAARKNGRTAHQANSKKAMNLYHSGAYPTLQQAWDAVKNKTSKSNPKRRKTARKNSATVSRRFRAETTDFWGPNPQRTGAFAYRQGQFSTSKTSGFQPVNRRNPAKKRKPAKKARKNTGAKLVGPVHYAKNGTPYRHTADGKPRFISKAAAAKANPRHAHFRQGSTPDAGVWRRGGPLSYRGGQFSTVGTGGFQPVNRRNPGKKRKATKRKTRSRR